MVTVENENVSAFFLAFTFPGFGYEWNIKLH